MLLYEAASKVQILIHRPNDSVCMFRMRFGPSDYKMQLQDWINTHLNLVQMGERQDEVDGLSYLVIGILDELPLHIRKAVFTSTSLRHLWRPRDIRLSAIGRVYTTTVRSIVL